MWKDIKTAPLDRKVLMYRPDAKKIVHDFASKDYINHPEYAYTRWMEAPPLPPEDNIYDEIPSDIEP